MKQLMELSYPQTTTVRGQLFLEFSVDNLGPNSPLWGKIATKKEINQLSDSFFSFYSQNYVKRGAPDHFTRLQKADLADALVHGLRVTLLNKISEDEEKKVDIFFQNLNTFCAKQSDWQGLQRHPSPPLEAYQPRSEYEIGHLPSYYLLFEK